MPTYTEITRCRACGDGQLAQVVDLGLFSVSDFRSKPTDFTDCAPLMLLRCSRCTLVQLRHTVDRQRLYRQYWYRSGVQESMVAALRDVVADARARVELAPGDIVLDIGANDGTLLRMWDANLTRIGFEPAQNLFADASRHDCGKPNFIFPGYWPARYDIREPAKVITSIACFYDADDPSAFVEAIKRWLHPDGVWINQLAYLPDTLRANNFGDICHEHLTYWSTVPFQRLLREHGLCIASVSRNDVNGGSMRFVVRHCRDDHQHELLMDRVSETDLRAFGQRIRLQRTDVRDFLQQAKREGQSVVGYGASTKGNSYLQYWGVDPDLLAVIADRNPEKVGKYVPTGQRVISEDEMRAMHPRYLLALPFHFIDSFVQRERDLLASGTEFIVPFPELRLVGADALAQAA